MAGITFPNYVAPMANLGVDATESDRRALGLKLWSGEVLNAYMETNMTAGTVRKVVLGSGTSQQFPVTGRVKGGFAKPGVALNQDTPEQMEITIDADDIMYASIFLPLQYDLVGHLNFRQEYAKQAGEVLANSEDRMHFAEIYKAAHTAAFFGAAGASQGHYPGRIIQSDLFLNDGGVVGSADDNGVANALFNALFQAAEIYATQRIPEGSPRFCAMRFHEYYILIRAIQSGGFSLSNKWYMNETANLNQPSLPMIAGFTIVPTNNLPKVDLTGTGASADVNPNVLVSDPLHVKHEADFSKVIGLIWRPENVGSVVVQGIATQQETQLGSLGDLLVSYMMNGAGVLDPNGAISLELNTLVNP